MIYENKIQAFAICEEIETHVGKLNDLDESQVIQIRNAHGHILHTIAVEPFSEDEYAAAGMVMINFIKDSLRRKIADSHVELEKL